MSNVDPTALAAHEIAHLVIDDTATGIRADADGWTVLSTEPPASGDDLMNRQAAGIIGEIVLRYGVEIGSAMAKRRETWQTAIGEADLFVLNLLPMNVLSAVYDRCAPTINRVLTDVGHKRLTAIGHRLLQMQPGDTLQFKLEDANV